MAEGMKSGLHGLGQNKQLCVCGCDHSFLAAEPDVLSISRVNESHKTTNLLLPAATISISQPSRATVTPVQKPPWLV